MIRNFAKKVLCKLFLFKKINNGVEKARALGVSVGNNCRLIDVSFSSEPYLVTIGDHVSATKTHFETHDGGVWVFRKKHPTWDVIKRITIGNNVYLGSGVTILPGVNISDNVVVGAGSIVTKNLESNFVYAGIPARKIKSLDDYYQKVSEQKIETKHLSLKEKRIFLTNLLN